MVSISACHAEDPGSILGCGVGSELMTFGLSHGQVASCAVAALRGRSSSINHERGIEIPSNTSNIAISPFIERASYGIPLFTERASCGIRAHDLPLTERVLCQLS